MKKSYLLFYVFSLILMITSGCQREEIRPELSASGAPKTQKNTDKALNAVKTTFRVFIDVGLGRAIYLTGGHPALDNWTAPGKAARWTSGNVWIFETFDIPQGQSFQFKTLRLNGGSNFSWEAGSNRTGVGGQTIDIYPGAYETGLNIDLFAGRIISHNVSGYLDIPGRNITVVLPPAYSTTETYPVVYMQDGKNCLDWDPFGGGGWQVHRTSDRLMRENKIQKVIFVLIDNMGDGNSGQRVYEYSPVSDPLAPSFYNGTVGGGGDNYIGFIINRVIPLVENTYRVSPGKDNRAIGGSSFGGLISFYAGWKYPNTFGKVIGMSSYFVWKSNWILGYVSNTAAPTANRFYIDSGTTSSIPFFTDDGRAVTIDMRNRMTAKGFVLNNNLRYWLQDGANHSEPAWRARFNLPLEFLFPK